MALSFTQREGIGFEEKRLKRFLDQKGNLVIEQFIFNRN